MKHSVNNIEDATRAFDTNTGQHVFLEEKLSDNFYIASTGENHYIIVKIDELTDLHRL